MKIRFILLIVMFLIVLLVKVQELVEIRIFFINWIILLYKIEVIFQKIVYIFFFFEVKYVDLGLFDIIVDKVMGVENVVCIKVVVKGFEGEMNFFVIIVDGCFYFFNVVYKDELVWFFIEMEDWFWDNFEGGIVGDCMFVKLKEFGGEILLVVNCIMYMLYKKNKRDIRYIGCKKYGIQILFKGFYINNDLLYLYIFLCNSLDILFDIDYICFKIIDKKVVKCMVMQENFIELVRIYNCLIMVDGKVMVCNIFVLFKFILLDDKLFVVEVYEKGGVCYQLFCIENIDFVVVKLISELYLK